MWLKIAWGVEPEPSQQDTERTSDVSPFRKTLAAGSVQSQVSMVTNGADISVRVESADQQALAEGQNTGSTLYEEELYQSFLAVIDARMLAVVGLTLIIILILRYTTVRGCRMPKAMPIVSIRRRESSLHQCRQLYHTLVL